MKKWAKILMWTGISLGIVGVVGGISYSVVKAVNNFSNISHQIVGNTLTRDEVNENFDIDGIWNNKTSLSSNDLLGYKNLDSNAFDDINLESITFPSNIKVKGDNAIKWYGVKKINVEENDVVNLKIIDNVLFRINDSIDTLSGTALSIADRTIKTNVEIKNLGDGMEGWFIRISDHFYDDKIFENVSSIKVEWNKVIFYGTSCFENCQKFTPNQKIYTLPYSGWFNHILYINSRAFKSSNISSIHFVSWGIMIPCTVVIADEAFANCDSLVSFKAPGLDTLLLKQKVFYNCPNLKNVNFGPISTVEVGDYALASDPNLLVASRNIRICAGRLSLSNNVFEGKYDNFVFVDENNQSVTRNLQYTQTTFANINASQLDLTISGNDKIKATYPWGLSTEQLNKANIEWYEASENTELYNSITKDYY